MLSTSISLVQFCIFLCHPKLFHWAVRNMFCHQNTPVFSVYFINFYKTTFIHLCPVMFYCKLLLFLQFFSVTFISILYICFFPSISKYGLRFSIQNISLSIHPVYLLSILILYLF